MSEAVPAGHKWPMLMQSCTSCYRFILDAESKHMLLLSVHTCKPWRKSVACCWVFLLMPRGLFYFIDDIKVMVHFSTELFTNEWSLERSGQSLDRSGVSFISYLHTACHHSLSSWELLSITHLPLSFFLAPHFLSLPISDPPHTHTHTSPSLFTHEHKYIKHVLSNCVKLEWHSVERVSLPIPVC